MSLLIGNGNGTFKAAMSTPTTGIQLSAIVLGDFNADNKVDMAVTGATSDDVHLLYGDGNGGFGGEVVLPVRPVAPIGIAVADFNGDGKLDIATANNVGFNFTVRIGNGDGTFQLVPTIYVGANNNPQGIMAGDLDKDGWPDIVLCTYSGASVALNDRRGNLKPLTQLPLKGSGVASAVAGDLNGDKLLDLVTSNSMSANISVLLGNGDGTFAAGTNYGVGLTPRSSAIGDLNGDNQADVVVANSDDSTISVLFNSNNGQGALMPAMSLPSPNSPFAIVIEDVNKDMVNDIVTGGSGKSPILITLGRRAVASNHQWGTPLPEPCNRSPCMISTATASRTWSWLAALRRARECFSATAMARSKSL